MSDQEQVRIDPPAHGVRLVSLRPWHGMALDAWLYSMRGKWHMVSPRRYPLVATITLLSIGNQLLKWGSALIFDRQVAKVEISPDPIFVIGYWRSGTTWLHQMMMSDPRHAAPESRACFCPETFLFGRFVINPILRLALPKKRPMDNVKVSADSGEEDEFGILLSGAASPINTARFPNDDAPAITAIEDMTPKEAARWRVKWLAFLRRVQFLNPGKRLVLKSPGHTVRTQEILKHFPNARFIHIVRDPYKIFLSGRKVQLAMYALCGFQDHTAPQPVRDARHVRRFVEFHEKFNADRALIPPAQITTVHFEDLQADPVSALRKIYDQLDLGDFSVTEAALQEQAETARDYQNNQYDLDPETRQLVESNYSDYFERYGYLPMAERPVAKD